MVLNVDNLVSALARHVTLRSSSEPSGSRHDDPGLSACDAQRQEVAYASSEWKRADGSRDAEALQCSAWAPVVVAVWMRVQCWRPVRRAMLAPMSPRPPVVKFACRSVSQWISSHRKRRILYESWGRVRSVLSSPLSAFVIMLEAISDGLADRADLCSYILPCKRAFDIREMLL